MHDVTEKRYFGIAGTTLESGPYRFGPRIELLPLRLRVPSRGPFACTPTDTEGARQGPVLHMGLVDPIDVTVQLEVAESEEPGEALHFVYLLMQLIRLRCKQPAFLAVSADGPLADKNCLVFVSYREPSAITKLASDSTSPIAECDLDWIHRTLPKFTGNQSNNKLFYVCQAFDEWRFARDRRLGVTMLWSGLESLFGGSGGATTLTLCGHLSSFLEPPGQARAELHARIKKLYADRSDFVHGRGQDAGGSLEELYAIARRALIKALDHGKAPGNGSLKQAFHGGLEWKDV
jgi:hypothetical protein